MIEIAASISDPRASKMIQQRLHGEGATQPSDMDDASMLVITLPTRANATRILVDPTIDIEPMP